VTQEKLSGSLAVSGAGRSVAAPGFGANDFRALPAGTHCEYVPIFAADGGGSRGYLYTRGGERTVVCFMHPRGDLSRHYAMPALIERGFATFGHNSRWANNDAACIHEVLLLDIAAGIRFLKERGFERVILVGNSGGGSLYTFYLAQALTASPGRLTDTAGGVPLDLDRFDLPVANGLVLLAAHIGQGKFLMRCIDPAVLDEADPLLSDPALDMYDERNGFKPLPRPSKYSSEFIAQYRQAQLVRVARLDCIARARIAEQRRYELMFPDPEGKASLRAFFQRRAMFSHVMNIYRTDANPESCDLSISPSKREVGSLVSKRPDLSNFSAGGFAWIQTPHAWLSTWSGISSRASLLENISRVTTPLLVVNYDGDNGVRPEDAEQMIEGCSSSDKSLYTIRGDHYGLDLSGSTRPREEAAERIGEWIRQRF